MTPYRSDGLAPGPEPVLGERGLPVLRPLLGGAQAALGLPVLRQVQVRDLLGLLDLLLVRLDLALQLVDEALHPLVVLPVLVLSVGQLLDGPLRLAEVLLGVAKPE